LYGWDLRRTDFTYDLPPELIAQTPRERGRSRMLAVTPNEGEPRLEHLSFAAFPAELSAGDVLVLNDTRVIPARLFARPREGMSRPIEVLLTRNLETPLIRPSGTFSPQAGRREFDGAGPQAGRREFDGAGPQAGRREFDFPRPAERGEGGRRPGEGPGQIWEAWAKPAKRLRPGDVLTFSDTLSAEVLSKEEGTVTLRFNGDLEEIDRIGVMPLPPYIARPEAKESDRESYQTVYASERGAIAAPTAGLHFTHEILKELEARGVEIVRVTLHVGIGTFQPVKADDIADHRMQTERYEITESAAAALNRALGERRRIVAAGTTSVRTLESAIRAGDGRITAGRAETSIFITPGFDFRIVDSLLTNFHLPESTLLMLVSAFAGMETVRSAYREAIRERYFFFSYGDCMFLRNRGRW
jgi:S-adenosylmethionine:tRNA ribosyltransferase-isomerase